VNLKRLSAEARKVLLKIYIGQNIRNEGILQSQIRDVNVLQTLLSGGFIRENHWYLYQFLTTEKGSRLAKSIVGKKIKANKDKFLKKTERIPSKFLTFFTRRYISTNLASPAERACFEARNGFSSSWKDSILTDGRVWLLWNDFFESLRSLELCVKTLDYVSTRGGETRYHHYVIPPQVREFLVSKFSESDFASDDEQMLWLYSFLINAKRILARDDVEQVRQQFYESLKTFQVTEDQVAGIINEMSEQGITSEYRGLLSEWKPFYIMNLTKYGIYLFNSIIQPAIQILSEGKGTIKKYSVEEKNPTLSEVKSELGILDRRELGDFYVLVSNLERELREFLKEKLGKSWKKRVENDVPTVYGFWEGKRNRDIKWGIEPEKELINYADLGDYILILRQYSRIFSDGIEDLGDILTHLKIWYNHGRNPIMHSRTVNKQKFYTTKSAIEFLLEWMRRKS